jgi:hypothetical protein
MDLGCEDRAEIGFGEAGVGGGMAARPVDPLDLPAPS